MAKRRVFTVERSQSLLARARKVEALIDARPGLFFTGVERLGGYPLFVERASGPFLWDIDGNKYLDFILGYGSVILGHSHPTVSKAVRRQAQRLGGNPTLLNLQHVELAEKIVALNPSVESVTFLKTGSDATDAAIRLARAVTGRKHVLHWGLHGWHDWCAPVPTGVLEATTRHTTALRYNDLDHAKSLLTRLGSDVACVMVLPYEIDCPAPGYLTGLRELCRQHGALFILDEIRSGFRISLGGAQAHFGVEADLVTYGKAMANGYAISALAGRKAYMKDVLSLGLTVTYFRMPDAMAAANATIDELVRADVPGRLARLGSRLMAGLDRVANEAGVPASSIGLPWTPFLQFSYSSSSDCERALRMFCNGMLSRGVLLSPSHHWFVCSSMDEADIDRTIEISREVFADLRRFF